MHDILGSPGYTAGKRVGVRVRVGISGVVAFCVSRTMQNSYDAQTTGRGRSQHYCGGVDCGLPMVAFRRHNANAKC